MTDPSPLPVPTLRLDCDGWRYDVVGRRYALKTPGARTFVEIDLAAWLHWGNNLPPITGYAAYPKAGSVLAIESIRVENEVLKFAVAGGRLGSVETLRWRASTTVQRAAGSIRLRIVER